MVRAAISILVAVGLAGPAAADPGEEPSASAVDPLASAVEESATTQPDPMDADMAAEIEEAAKPSESPFPRKDYSGDIWNRPAATGDWGGLRQELADNGISFQLDVTQIIQGNAHGGAETDNGFRYSGSTDYWLKFDTTRMGLWPGGLLYVQGETMFGRSINGKVGSLMAANADALFPVPDEPGETTLTNVVYTQFFSEHFGIAFGKIDFRGGDQNVFAHDERSQFMNLAFLANPTILPYAPYTALNASIFFRPTDWLTVAFSALDAYGSATRSGFETAFHSPQGTSFLSEWTFTIKPFGLPGHQRVGVIFSTRNFKLLDQDPRFLLPIIGRIRSLITTRLNPDTRPDDWAFWYNFDQYVYTEDEDPEQGIGLFGRFGWSSGEANPITQFYSLGVGGKGIIPTRDKDTFGLGYYYVNLSNDLPSLFGLNSEQGVELYYNIEVTPWLHITPDLQVVINPGGGDNDVAIVYGLRTQLSF
jgi:porin